MWRACSENLAETNREIVGHVKLMLWDGAGGAALGICGWIYLTK
ncbi:MAG: hypothetical protein JWQ17_3162 [Tardiphaga sp.]|jgi:hypothetical protein|nr:hypothetical protein [Tardiphaga sp.]